MSANVRSIEAMRDLRGAVVEWASRVEDHLFELRSEARRALQWASVEQPQYWRRQIALTERMLQEALDRLAAMQATYGGRDRPRATEARQRVHELRQRLRFCQERQAACRAWAAEIEQAVDQLIGATAGLQQQAESAMPAAAAQLSQWIAALDRYAEVRSQPAGTPDDSQSRHDEAAQQSIDDLPDHKPDSPK